jgi:gliding motility-associated-like protein
MKDYKIKRLLTSVPLFKQIKILICSKGFYSIKSLAFIFFFKTVVFAQFNPNTQGLSHETGSFNENSKGWKVDAYDHWFVENKHEGWKMDENQVLFTSFTKIGYLLFTEDAIFFVRSRKLSPEEIEEFKENHEARERGLDIAPLTSPSPYIHKLTFLNTNDGKMVEGVEELEHYTMVGDKKSTDFTKLIYRNLYENIDVEFFLPEEGGLKYNIIIHPHGKISDIKFEHQDSYVKLQPDGSMTFLSKGFSISDRRPTAQYSDSADQIEVKFNIHRDIVTFDIAPYDDSRTIIIDPWFEYSPPYISIPPDLAPDPFGGGDLVDNAIDSIYVHVHYKDIDFDFSDNVYAQMLLRKELFISPLGFTFYDTLPESYIRKYNSSGVLIWSSIGPNQTVDLSVNPSTEEVYSITGGVYPEFIRITDEFGVPWTDTVDLNVGEVWTVRYDPCYDTLIFGRGICEDADHNEYTFTNSGITSHVNFSPFSCGFIWQESNVISLDPQGGSVYFIMNQYANADMFPPVPGKLYKVSYTEAGMASSPQWITDTYSSRFTELVVGDYLASGFKYVYEYSQESLSKFDKLTGAFLGEVTPGLPPYLDPLEMAPYGALGYQGIDVDLCGNIYIGRSDHIEVYNSDLTFMFDISTETDSVMDIKIKGKTLMVGGSEYLESIDLDFIMFESVPDSCGTCIGSATIIGCDDLDSLEILWSDGQTTPTAIGLCEGWYSVIISGGCFGEMATDSIYVSNLDDACGLNITLPSDTICEGACIDLIANVTSGTGPYTFEWSPGLAAETGDSVNVCPLMTTTYQVIVTDALGETDTTMATITVLTPPVVNLGADTLLCEGDTLSLDAENPGSIYLWQDGSIDQSFLVVSEGTYWVEVNNGGCSTRDSIVVTYVELEVDLGPDTSICIIEDFILDASNPGLDYLWQDGSTNQTFDVTDLGTYFVTVLDVGSGCQVSDTIIISPGSLVVNLGNDTVLCATESVLLDAENPGALYLWTDGSTDQTITVSSTGLYSVYVEQGFCNATDSVHIDFQTPLADFSASDYEGCAPKDILFTDLSFSPTSIASWSWNFDDGGTSSLENPSHTFVTSGIYDVSLEITTAEGCLSEIVKTVEITIYDQPVADFRFDPESPSFNESVTFEDLSINAAAWQWAFGDGGTSTNQNPTYTYEDRGVYDVVLIVNNEICYDTARYTIIIEEPIIFYVPNVFTPDGNSFNEIFQPVFTSGFDPYDFHLSIFNRWGELIFESYDASKGWNGSYGTNGLVQDGVFVWKIEFNDINSDKKYTYSGHVTVLK